ncbi:MAG TPA: hypothetical protein VGZ48_03235 [Candidatus Acidoferrales bacterium]|nr:hypothetical protein [Candidatus Acidoferrales bacterium]
MQLGRVSIQRIRTRTDETRLHPEQMGTVIVTESPVALVITAILVMMMIYKVPESALFFLGVLVLGSLTGIILWWRHRSGF